MSLNIKNERVTALVRELANRTGRTQTGAIEEAVRSRLAEMDKEQSATEGSPASERKQANAMQLVGELHRSLTEKERSRLRTAEGELYDDAGLPA
jgi:antitoxin VapB